MNVYVVKNDKNAKDILQLLKLYYECARVHTSKSITIPRSITGNLGNTEQWIEAEVEKMAGSPRDELTEEQENALINVIKKNKNLKDSLGTGVILRGKDAQDVSRVIRNISALEKVQSAISTGNNVVIF
jgi:hypothetical protein